MLVLHCRSVVLLVRVVVNGIRLKEDQYIQGL